MPYRKKKRPLRGIGVPVGAFCPIAPTWCGDDFGSTRPGHARDLKLLNVDRRSPGVPWPSRWSVTSTPTGSWSSSLTEWRTTRWRTSYVRFDHGPEFIAYAVADWCRFNGAGHGLHRPGVPLAERLGESFNGRLRDEPLNGQRFDSLLGGQGVHRGLGQASTTT